MKQQALLLATGGIISTYLMHHYSKNYNLKILHFTNETNYPVSKHYRILTTNAKLFDLSTASIEPIYTFTLNKHFGKNMCRAEILSKCDVYDGFAFFILSLATLYASMLNISNTIILGFTKDYSKNITNVLNSFQQAAETILPNANIITPFIDKTLEESYSIIKDYKTPIEHTISCLHDSQAGCSHCHKCLTKLKVYGKLY